MIKNLVSIIVAITMALSIPVASVLATSNREDELTEEEKEIWHTNQGNRPDINPDFDPDFDCIYDVSQIHCIPDSEQKCPKPQFSAGDPQMCFPKTFINGKWQWECPEDYHSREDDETGQCYPDSEGCEWDYYIMLESEDGNGNTCRTLYSICSSEEHREEDYCIEYCEEVQNAMGCSNRKQN